MQPYYQDDLVTIYHGDCRELSAAADLIVTDPPYPMEFAAAWDALAVVALSTLPAGGMVFAYSGQYNLPDVMRRLEDGGLLYRWMLATVHCNVGMQETNRRNAGNKPT